MGSIIGACIGSMCTGICCNTCRECEGQKYGVISRIPYIFLFFISGVFSIIMSLYGTTALDLEFYTTSICNSSTCAGNGSVFRVSFMLFVFEFIHVIIIGAGAISFHWLFFIIKLLIFTAFLTLTFVVGDSSGSNAFFQGYADYFARYVSAIYLFLQILILIAYGHKINEFLQEKGNEMNASNRDSISQRDEDSKSNSCNKYFYILGISTFTLFVSSLTLCGFFFSWYGSDGSCSVQRTLISLTIVMIVLNFTISAVRGDGSLFVSAIVSFYVAFLCFVAMQANEDKTCNIFANYRSTASLWIGFMLTFIAIFYAAFRADRIGVLWETKEDEYILMDSTDNQHDDNQHDVNKLDESEKKKESKKQTTEDEKKNDDNKSCDNNINDGAKKRKNIPSKRAQKISNVYFHFILMLAACYFAMLYSDWGTGTELKATGQETMWVNIATQYVTIFLYWWTLLAPVICPSRFRKEEEEEEREQVQQRESEHMTAV